MNEFDEIYTRMLEYRENVKRKIENAQTMKDMKELVQTEKLNFNKMFSKSQKYRSETPFLERQKMFES